MSKRIFFRFAGALLALTLLCGCTAKPAENSSLPDVLDGSSFVPPADSSTTASSSAAVDKPPASSAATTESTTLAGTKSTSSTRTAATTTSAPTTTAFPTVGTIDLMDTAIGLSGYAQSGLWNLDYHNIGSGVYADYNELHANPLSTAAYVLNTRQWAGRIDGPAALAPFCRTALAEQGLRTAIGEQTPLTDLSAALTELFQNAGDTAGLPAAKAACADVAADLKKPLARFISAAAAAYQLIRLETAHVTEAEFAAILSFDYCTPASGDTGKLKTMQEVYGKVSEEVLLTAGMWVTHAAAELAASCSKLSAFTKSGKALTISTPIGDIWLGSTGDDTYTSPGTLLLMDPAGNDTYIGRVASNDSLERPLSVVIDQKGNDHYTADIRAGGTQGCGVLGVGILLDIAGNDTYDAVRLAQGCALLGTGVLYDGGGNDNYDCNVTGQAAGFYGLAVLADQKGDDTYHGFGFVQASAGTRCQAYLIDIAGDDRYTVETDEVAGYEGLDYGQFPDINGNWSQGCGWGQRVINVAGGIAGLIDITGNDRYAGGIWVQGTGYWSGVGFLADTAGNDFYESCYYSQSSVAHYGVAALVDIGGNDEHTLRSGKKPSGKGASFGFTWDRGTALFVNDGGTDFYIASCYSGGSAMSAYDEKGIANQDLTYAIFIDTEGFDYYSGAGTDSWGYGRGGYFIDAGGEDTNRGWLRRQNQMSTGLDGQEGGVYIDYEPGPDTPAAPVIGFWEEAKAAVGLG